MGGLKKMIALPILAAAFSLLLYPSAAAVMNGDMMFINYHIHIANNLPNDLPSGTPSLNLHCKSANKDIGWKSMLPGDDYTFDTKINVFRTTLFFCYAQWVEGKQQHFNAFDAKRDERRCRTHDNSCLWSVRNDGIYFSDDNVHWVNSYPW